MNRIGRLRAADIAFPDRLPAGIGVALIVFLMTSCTLLPRSSLDALTPSGRTSPVVVALGLVEVECGTESASVRRELERLVPATLADLGLAGEDGSRARFIVELTVVERQFLRGAVYLRSIVVEARFRPRGSAPAVESAGLVVRRALESEDSVVSSWTLARLVREVLSKAAAELSANAAAAGG